MPIAPRQVKPSRRRPRKIWAAPGPVSRRAARERPDGAAVTGWRRRPRRRSRSCRRSRTSRPARCHHRVRMNHPRPASGRP